LSLILDETDEYSPWNTSDTRLLPKPLLDFIPSARVIFQYQHERDCALFQYWPQFHSREVCARFLSADILMLCFSLFTFFCLFACCFCLLVGFVLFLDARVCLFVCSVGSHFRQSPIFSSE
jgi:hypothetical protein